MFETGVRPRCPLRTRRRSTSATPACAPPAIARWTPCASRPAAAPGAAELGPDETPFEAGLEFVVSLDKPAFIGRKALLAARAQPLRKKFVTLVFDDPAVYAWGGETVSIGGDAVGELSSVGWGWGWAAGRCVALGYVRGDAAAVAHAGTPVTVDLWGQAVGARAWDRWSAQTG